MENREPTRIDEDPRAKTIFMIHGDLLPEN
jgi:hypothetical protein